ncbi:MAG: PglZ domain-containing protein [Bacteroidetes bacterium]|jgi:CheY-like chemotaxis protein|nr:PglZ domain-containing protein [Bacteroidota bacterium]
MRTISILWTDDEVDLLKPHILFLENKGYEVQTASNGHDAIEWVKQKQFDLIFLDESMPGLSGLETLAEIKSVNSAIPVIMITKNEAEDIMDAAIGSKISDYLLKPVNPKQILLTIKKHIDTSRLVTRETTTAYQSEFSKLGMLINEARSFDQWAEIYKKLVYWEIELEQLDDESIKEVLFMQKNEANQGFAKYIKSNYTGWFNDKATNAPLLSPNLLRKKLFPLTEKNEKVFFILIDNLRYDQWRAMVPNLTEYFLISEEDIYCSILPTATAYARNAQFAGLMPLEIKKFYPDLWVDDNEEGGKNLNEEQFMARQLQRLGINSSFHYQKISDSKTGKKITEELKQYLHYDLNVLVYNFVDMLSHARTEMQMIKELASNESAYRSITLSWFRHSYLYDLLRMLAEQNIKVVITTDHGTMRVQNPVKVMGDRETSVNLRYKIGKNLNYKSKDIFEVKDPEAIHLPKINVSSTYIFTTNTDFMAYPNNFNYYANYYKNTFQHGGISLEEMLIPYIVLSPKN